MPFRGVAVIVPPSPVRMGDECDRIRGGRRDISAAILDCHLNRW